MPRLITFSALLLCLNLAWAASTDPKDAGSDEEPDRYDIELIIFERRPPNSGEHYPVDPGKPDPALARGELTDRDLKPGELIGNEAELLPREVEELGPIAYTINKRLPGGRTLLHLAWRQPVHDRANPYGFWIKAKRLRGLVRVTRGRYLHLNLDLLHGDGLAELFSRQPVPASVPIAADSQAQPESPKTTTTPAYVRVIAQRKMRSTELHYLDHPRLGVLVKANRYVPPEPPPEPPPASDQPAPAVAPAADAAGPGTGPAAAPPAATPPKAN